MFKTKGRILKTYLVYWTINKSNPQNQVIILVVRTGTKRHVKQNWGWKLLAASALTGFTTNTAAVPSRQQTPLI